MAPAVPAAPTVIPPWQAATLPAPAPTSAPLGLFLLTTVAQVERVDITAIHRFEAELGGTAGTTTIAEILSVPKALLEGALSSTIHGPALTPLQAAGVVQALNAAGAGPSAGRVVPFTRDQAEA